MKKFSFILISVFFLIINCNKLRAQTVYITENGKKYHSKNCDLAKTGKKGISLAEAKKQGYEACKKCKAPTELQAVDKPKEVKKENSKK
jgi:NOL1/NOP2/fmu family ribosome biogenesis protein